MNDRAKSIAIAGAGIVLSGWLYVERVLPLVRASNAAKKEVAALRASAGSQVRKAAAGPESRLEAAEDLIAKHKATIARLDATPTRDEARALASLSQLAARCGVVVRESAPVVAAATPPGESPAPDPLGGRARRRLTVVTRFPGLRAFTSGLATLPGGPIHLESLDVASVEVAMPDRTPGEEAPRVLVVTMVLVP